MAYATVKREIEVEFLDDNGEKDYRYINVEFNVKGKHVDLSFSHEFGVERKWGWEEIFVKWDESLHTDSDNDIIREYVDKYFDDFIEEL
jgi:hypothetical protein